MKFVALFFLGIQHGFTAQKWGIYQTCTTYVLSQITPFEREK